MTTADTHSGSALLDVPQHLALLRQVLQHLDQLQVHTTARTEFELAVVNLEARVRFNGNPIGQQLSLAKLCPAGAALLFDALGYYALIDADPLLTSNEPLPYAEERALLAQLNAVPLPDERLLRDAVTLAAE